jgi:hypothetical protein
MSKLAKETNHILPVKVPVPPMLSKAFGYKGETRYVAFKWTPYGDEAEYSDGRVSANGNWQAFLSYVHRIGKFIFRFSQVPMTQG